MLEPPVKWYVVGSTQLGKEHPNDLDLLCVMEEEDFEFAYGMDRWEFQRQFKIKPRTPKIERWRTEVRGARRVLETLFPYRKVDLKIIARSMLYEPYSEIDLHDLEDYR